MATTFPGARVLQTRPECRPYDLAKPCRSKTGSSPPKNAGTDAADARVKALREALRDLSLPAVAKQVLLNEGVLAHADVRLPLRGLTPEERGRVASL